MSEINKAAQALGALGGKARARSISKERAREIGRKAGLASAAKRKQAQDTQAQEKRDSGHPDAGTGQSEAQPN